MMTSGNVVTAKGKRAGTPNYKNEILLSLIDHYLPAGAEQWKIVAMKYQELSKETSLEIMMTSRDTSMISCAKRISDRPESTTSRALFRLLLVLKRSRERF